MICGNCGFHNEPGNEFCVSCGKFLEWVEGTEPDPEAGPGSDTSAELEEETEAETEVEPESGPDTESDPETGLVDETGPDETGPVPVLPVNLVVCTVCSTANDSSLAFCTKCGAKLPKSGITRGRTRGKDKVNWPVIGIIAAVLAVLLLVGGIALAGFLGGPSATGSPGAGGSPIAQASAGASSSIPPDASGAPTPSAAPGSLDPSAQPTDTSAPGTPTPAPPSGQPSLAPGTFSCQTQQHSAPASGRWRVFNTMYGERSRFDYLTLLLQPIGESDSTAGVEAFVVPSSDVQSQFGLPGPASTETAVVLAFNDAVGVGEIIATPDNRVIKEFRIDRNGSGRVIAVIGVAGSGCFNLSSRGWEGPDPAELTVRIGRPGAT